MEIFGIPLSPYQKEHLISNCTMVQTFSVSVHSLEIRDFTEM